jgi:DNA-binding transcriptional regulator YdaS (Cro superfamily)
MDGKQLLADYIKRNKASQAKFARDVGCSDSHLCLVLKGKRGVSADLAKRISAATDGTVPARALVSDKFLLEAAE